MSHGRDTRPKAFGVLAEFKTPEDLLRAAQAARDKGYRDIEGYSPIPVHGLTEIIGFKDEKLGWAVFGAGLTGALLGFGLQIYTSAGWKIGDGTGFLQISGLNGYAHNVGGKPMISLEAFVPPAYELTILLAGLTAAGAMLAFNGLPKPHHPVFNAECMQRASADRFVLSIEASDPLFNVDEVTEFFRSLDPETVEYVRTSEGY